MCIQQMLNKKHQLQYIDTRRPEKYLGIMGSGNQSLHDQPSLNMHPWELATNTDLHSINYCSTKGGGLQYSLQLRTVHCTLYR